MRTMYVFGLCALVGALLFPGGLFAAHLFLDPDTSTYGRQDTFYVPIRIETHGECVNAVELALAYNPAVLSVQDVVTGDSIITLWTERPTIEKNGAVQTGRVTLSGGIPGGYCGRVEGDPGQTNVLAKLVVTGTPSTAPVGTVATTSIIVEPGAAVYLNDGVGSEAELTVVGTNLLLVAATSSSENVWLGDVRSDTLAPDYFDITLVEGPSAGKREHYIVFNTTDKQSGIDHYEVLETDPNQFGFLIWTAREAHWVVAESPYVLRDQKLRSKIMVKAVDKNGNERVTEYVPPMSFLEEYTRASVLIPSITLLVLVLVALLLLGHLARARRHIEATEEPLLHEEPYDEHQS